MGVGVEVVVGVGTIVLIAVGFGVGVKIFFSYSSPAMYEYGAMVIGFLLKIWYSFLLVAKS
ncbi:hypothetical protein DRP05_09365 [Archaeoglobales archaeon]|nr:MAG: hypothetical protein DRP05_09365 [Archaeoglobales archaeon]